MAAKKVSTPAADEMLVRIKPSNKRATHTAEGVIIHKTDGWVTLPRATALKLAEEPMDDAFPASSPKVFDVMEQHQARVVEEAEQVRVEPAGTTTKPKRAQQVPAARR